MAVTDRVAMKWPSARLGLELLIGVGRVEETATDPGRTRVGGLDPPSSSL